MLTVWARTPKPRNDAVMNSSRGLHLAGHYRVVFIPDYLSLATECPIPLIAAGGQDHVRVGFQVDRFLLAWAGGEVDGVPQPNGD